MSDPGLTDAEAAVLAGIAAAAGWRGIDHPRGSRTARIVLAKVRPIIAAEALREARRKLAETQATPEHDPSSKFITLGVKWAADLLWAMADELEARDA